MKTKFYFAAALFLMVGVAFSSCSKEEELLNGGNTTGELDHNAQQIVLSVENESGNLTTRAGRPLVTSKPHDKIEKVKVIIVKEDESQSKRTVAYVGTVDWTPETKSKIVSLSEEEKLDVGNYTIYALGYSDDTNYDLDKLPTKDSECPNYLELSMKNGIANKGVAEEIFAGSSEGDGGAPEQGSTHVYQRGTVKVTESKKSFNETITMSRQVAGIMIYVSNIPIAPSFSGTVADLKLQLVASNANNTLVLGHLLNKAVETSKNYVVNAYDNETVTAASSSDDVFVLMETRIGDWFGEDAKRDESTNNVTGKWNNPLFDSGLTFAKQNTVFMSAFVMPFRYDDNINNNRTLELQLVDPNQSNTVLSSWGIQHSDGTEFAQGYEYCWYDKSSSDFKHEKPQTENKDKYSIFRNQLYRVGNMGDDPTVNDPITLSDKNQVFNLKADNNWTMDHGMIIQ